MSGSTESLRRKIGSAGDLNGVVRSMKALAASSVGQYERAVLSLEDYYRTVELALSACLRQEGPAPPAVTAHRRGAAAVGAVVFGSDQGLVGQFNEVLMEFALGNLAALPGKTAKIWAVGERIQALVPDGSPVPSRLLAVPTSASAIAALIGQLIIEIQAASERGEVGDVYIFHNHPKAGSVYEPVRTQLLPLDQLWRKRLIALPWPSRQKPEIIEGRSQALPAFIRGYLFVLLYQACAESLASENASRLAAMQRAEKNIGEILEDLNRTFHRQRQESIDEELFDVVSGYEALARPIPAH
jgi:F-type H+-transporting ATPase subunit gamma